MATVDIRDVRKAFGPFEVLHGVSVAIADGEFVVLVGPSGCGKSTLLRMLAGLENITSGEIAIGSKVVNAVPPKDRDIAMVFQNYALYPHMTVFDNMAFSMTLAKAPKALMEQEVGRAAKILGLEELLQRFPRQLSGGQRQRVAMGRAIVRNPQVFLFDEPLSNLDAKLRVQMRLEIKRLQRELSVTSIYVTHDQVEAMTLADRLIVMNGGVAEQIGTPMDVYDKPATTFVAGFIGSPAMNFMSGKVADSRQSIDLTSTGAAKVNLPLNGPTSAAPGTPVSVGIRPEHMLPYANGPLELDIELAEPLGADTLLHGKVGAMRELMTIRLPGHVLAKPGDKRRFNIDAKNLHLFEQQSGKRIADV